MPSSKGPASPRLSEEDFYLERGLMVFTREYHLKRGFCCETGCRHCPWNFAARGKTEKDAGGNES